MIRTLSTPGTAPTESHVSHEVQRESSPESDAVAAATATPAMSVILPTIHDFSTIQRTVRAMRAQTIRDRIELVIVAPSADIEIDPREISGFANVLIVAGGPVTSSNRARIHGIREATAPIVVMSEDHCFPEPDWAEALLGAHEDGRAVVGPVFRNANPVTLLSWMNFLLEYGEWHEQSSGGTRPEVAGHNSAYKRNLLLAYGSDLEQLFEVEGVVQRDLAARGHRLWVEPAARTNHLNFSRWGPALSLRFHASRVFAGFRRQGWSISRRLTYILGSPLIPVVRLIRIVRMLATSPHRSLLPRIVPTLIVGLVVSGVGELVGYVVGPGASTEYLATIEFDRLRFMSDGDRQAYAPEPSLISAEPRPNRGVAPSLT
jgi:hypothetical protein